jgi:hypothetical protein
VVDQHNSKSLRSRVVGRRYPRNRTTLARRRFYQGKI